MRTNNETTYNNDAANSAALIYIAAISALCSVSLLLICFCLIRSKLQEEKTNHENVNRIASGDAISIRIEQELPSNQRPGL